MTSPWPIVNLGQVIRHRKEFIVLDDLTEYKRCRVQLHAKGVILRDVIHGSDIKTKKQQVCRSGEFLVAEIDAKLGGFGIVPDELDGAIVSSHYFLYEIEETELDRRFLDFYIRTRAFRNQVDAQGSTNYAAIRPHHVLDYTIPLPPLDEQRRIVARVDALAARIAEAQALRSQALTEAEAVMGAARKRLIGAISGKNWVLLSEFVKKIENGKSPRCESRQADIDEWGVVKVGVVSYGYFKADENKALPPTIEPVEAYRIRPGDFLMSRANTRELVGACAVVPETESKLLLSDKIFRFVFHSGVEINVRYLDHVLKSPALREQIESKATGTSPSMKNISKKKVLSLSVPQHSEDEQRRIVAHLDALQAKVDAVKDLQAATQAELNALLPAVLDRAFKGEL
ncbi:MAG: restriction endonuclease subunit S [Caldilineaceae bacterium]|nr:restriction endonuclease subunit S [Caldilineaceae bacterium]